MREFKLNVAQKGFFAGPVFYIPSSSKSSGEVRVACNAGQEIAKLHSAIASLKMRIGKKGSSAGNGEINGIVLSILDDEAFTGRIEEKIKDLSCDMSSAVLEVAEELSSDLNKVRSEYIRSRQDDIRGVADELVSLAEGIESTPLQRSAICSSELSPARLSGFDEALVGALLTEKGSPNSHVSIMAGNLGIPYLYGSNEAVMAVAEAKFIIVDSEKKTVVTDPDERTRESAIERMERIAKSRRDEKQECCQCRTKIYANIEGPQDIEALLKSNADGVGLFRTEFLFLGRRDIPAEEEQFEAYSAVLDAMGQREVIIRTMDIGSDKKVPCLGFSEESNPALGLRGARVSLERKELFHTQLRALLRAAARGNLKVMFPMIASAWEIDEIMAEVDKAADELKRDGIEYRMPPFGIMVETPAAALCAEKLAEKVSFFSIGTNDLTQYTLAIDREAQGLDRYFNPHHEAVFKLVKLTADAGRKHGIETGVCGQLASDPEAVKRLIQSGVTELSVAIGKVQATRKLAAGAERLMEKEQQADEEEPSSLPELFAVADGELVPMQDIPDPVFSSGTLGKCFGILPSNGNVYSPVSGTVVSISKTGHAITIRTDEGAEILVHVGIDTVTLDKSVFTHHVRCSEHVCCGSLIMEADLDAIRSAGLSEMIVVVFP